jgi:hypothetical protein
MASQHAVAWGALFAFEMKDFFEWSEAGAECADEGLQNSLFVAGQVKPRRSRG